MHKSTFANLQNNDVGLLSNVELRKNIARFYDFFSTAIQKIENDYPSYQTYETKLPFFLKYCKLDPSDAEVFIENPNDQDYYNPDFAKQPIEMVDYNGAKADEAFKIVLNESIFFRQVKLDYYIDIVERIKELNTAIEEELDVLESEI